MRRYPNSIEFSMKSTKFECRIKTLVAWFQLFRNVVPWYVYTAGGKYWAHHSWNGIVMAWLFWRREWSVYWDDRSYISGDWYFSNGAVSFCDDRLPPISKRVGCDMTRTSRCYSIQPQIYSSTILTYHKSTGGKVPRSCVSYSRSPSGRSNLRDGDWMCAFDKGVWWDFILVGAVCLALGI